MGNLAQVQVGPYRNLRTQMAATTTFGSGVPYMMTFRIWFTNTAHFKAFLAISRILVTTSSASILLPVCNGHPKLNVGQCWLTR